MSTRCNIIIKGRFGDTVTLYHHHDGYPSGVGSILKALCKEMTEKNYWYDASELANELIKNGITLKHKPEDLKNDEYELTSGLHGDIEYLYILYAYPNRHKYEVVGYATRCQFDVLKFRQKIEIPDLEEGYKIDF